MNRDELAARLQAIFLVELEEQLRVLNDDLLALERAPADPERLASLFRVVHTLKGAAHAANVAPAEEVCHDLESLLARAREGKVALGEEQFSLLFAAADGLADAGERLRTGRSLDDSRLSGLARSLRTPSASARREAPSRKVGGAAGPEAAPPSPPVPSATHEPGREQVRVEADKLDALLASAGQLLAASGRVGARAQQLEELHDHLGRWTLIWRRTARRLRPLLEQAEVSASLQQDLADSKEGLRQLLEATGELVREACEDARVLTHGTGELGERVRHLRLRPFSDACVALPRAVRDLAASSGKEARLVIEGGDVEADRAVLNVIHEVLLHLVRNAVDHGIEPPGEREAQGKPREGIISVSAAHRGRRLVVSVADDGRGVDLHAARAHLERAGYPLPASGEEIARALFRPGFSTRAEATAISGRGVGLDAVRTAIERIRGSVQVSWEEGQGTRFTLECPPSLATIRALLVAVGSQILAFPTVYVEHLARIEPEDIRTAEGREVILTREAPVPLVSLARLLGPPLADLTASGPLPVVLLAIGGRRLAIAVDDLLSEEEIMVRPLEKVRDPSPFVSGAALLPSGRVALVLNTSSVVETGLGRSAQGPALRSRGEAEPARKRILVVDDSLTTRALEQSLLEAAGFQVLTSVDGSQAWELLQAQPVDLVVSDVEMPRMDGFALCVAIRASERLARLPVVLVTALETPEHRERGLEVGADAYLPKSSFDQEDLLETIRSLLG